MGALVAHIPTEWNIIHNSYFRLRSGGDGTVLEFLIGLSGKVKFTDLNSIDHGLEAKDYGDEILVTIRPTADTYWGKTREQARKLASNARIQLLDVLLNKLG